MLKILSWNILQGGGSRIIKIVEALKSSEAHILVLSEFRNNATGNKLRFRLLQLGYRYQVVTSSESNANSVLLGSKISCNTEIYSGVDLEYDGNIATMHFEAFSVCGVYLPHKKRHTLFDKIKELNDSDVPFVFAGDFNCGINYIDQKGNSFWYEEEFKYLLNNGCKDAYRLVYGDVLDYSWYSHHGNGYRYDHTLVSDSLIPIVKDCRYLHIWRESKLSDHSPMLLTLA